MKKSHSLVLVICLMLLSAATGYAKDPKEAVKLLYKAWESYGEVQVGLYRQIIERFPDTGCAERARRDLANTLTGLGRVDEAIEEYRHYIEKYPGSTEARNAQSWIAQDIYGRGKFEEALQEYRCLLTMFPDLSVKEAAHTRWRVLELEYEKLKSISPELAVERYRQLTEESDYYRSDALWAVARICENDLKDSREAVACYQSYIESLPQGNSSAEAQWRIAEIKREDGDLSSACKWYRLIARDHAGSRQAGDAMMRLAFSGEQYAADGTGELAIETYRAFIELYPLQGEHGPDSGGYLGYGYEREIMKKTAVLHGERGECDKSAELYRKLLAYDEEFLPGSFTHLDRRVDYVIDFLDIYHSLEEVYLKAGHEGKAQEASRLRLALEGELSAIKGVVTEKFGSDTTSTVSFTRIDLNQDGAVVDISIMYSPRLGYGSRVWLNKNDQGWRIERSETTWEI